MRRTQRHPRRSRHLIVLLVVVVAPLLLVQQLWFIEPERRWSAFLSSADPPEGGEFATLPPGSKLPSDKECAGRVRRSSWEPRPDNTEANRTVPGPLQLGNTWGTEAALAYLTRVSGEFTGTTDEVIQWASCKWGFEVDLDRAVATEESHWRQSATGDVVDDQSKCVPGDQAPCPTSFGLMQVKWFNHPGTYPSSVRSTAFNLDYALAKRRACYEGELWFGPQTRGDLWGCVGSWASGEWRDSLALAYNQRVTRWYSERPWLHWSASDTQP